MWMKNAPRCALPSKQESDSCKSAKGHVNCKKGHLRLFGVLHKNMPIIDSQPLDFKVICGKKILTFKDLLEQNSICYVDANKSTKYSIGAASLNVPNGKVLPFLESTMAGPLCRWNKTCETMNNSRFEEPLCAVADFKEQCFNRFLIKANPKENTYYKTRMVT